MEFSDIVVKESPGLCRCCLSEGCYKDLSSEYIWMNENEVYADMLLECFDISITQQSDGPNGSSRLICEVCITRLRDACNFKKQVLDSEKKFIDMIGRGEFRPKILIYQAPMKKEDDGELQLHEVEYLDEEADFDDNEEVLQVSQTGLDEATSAHGTVTAETLTLKRKLAKPRKGKVGRAKKQNTVDAEEKPRSSKAVSKDKSLKPSETLDKNSDPNHKEMYRTSELIQFVTMIIENSTIIPFRWVSMFICLYCNCPFYEGNMLREHVLSEHSDVKITKTYRCFLGNPKLKLDISEIQCKKCYKEFDTLDDFCDHAAGKHKLKFNREATKWLFTFKLTASNCHECGQHFKFFSSMLKHAHKYHNKSHSYICEICGQGFVAKGNVDGHIKNVHHSNNKCTICKLEFPRYHEYKKHYDKEHRVFKCPICPEILNSQYLKRMHMAKVHDSKMYQFECDICGKMFSYRNKLLIHKNNVHLRDKTVTCEVCGFKTYSPEALKRHKVRHNDARPHQCPICMKTFTRKKNMEIHVRIHTNDKRYVCKECGKAYVQTTSLKLHMRVHHPKTE